METFAQNIKDAFIANGWKIDSITSTATKSFLTGVGFREARVYVSINPTEPGPRYECTLKAEYESEGRNILSTHFPNYNLSSLSSPEFINDSIMAYSDVVTKTVADSYAGRLAKGKTPLEPLQMLAAEAYCNGFDRKYFKEEIPDCGDGLLKFLMAELSSQEDCQDQETALQRVTSALAQLRRVETALLSTIVE